MKRVFTAQSLAELGHLRNLLEQAGIACLIKNEQLAGGLGEIPFLECLPELWVVFDDEEANAAALIRDAQATSVSADARPWACRECGASNEAQFAACWQCGAGDTAG
jgi:hypothetical protein